jgi:hypothetical protein
MIQCASKAFSSLKSDKKIELINKLDNWSVIRDDQLCQVIEQSSLSSYEKQVLKDKLARVGAFKDEPDEKKSIEIDDIPF